MPCRLVVAQRLNGVYVLAGMHQGWPRFERQVANVSGTVEPFSPTSYHLYYHVPYRMWFLNDAFHPSSDGRLGCIEAIDGQLPIAKNDLRWQFWSSKARLWQRRPLTVSLLRTTDEVIKYRAQSLAAEKAHAAALVVGTVAMTAEHVDKVFSVGIGGAREVEVSGGTLCEIVEVSSDYVGIRTEQVEICGQLYLPRELALATADQVAQWAEIKASLMRGMRGNARWSCHQYERCLHFSMSQRRRAQQGRIHSILRPSVSGATPPTLIKTTTSWGGRTSASKYSVG